MLQLQRQNDIMRLLKEKKELTVKELCATLYASPATVRRDLAELEKRGLLKRSFGGAVLTEDYSNQIPHFVRFSSNLPQKRQICAMAAKFIQSGDTIFVDSSSTTYFLAPHLAKIEDITVITNNPYLSIMLSELNVHNFCTGGEMLNDSGALVGGDAARFVSKIYAHKCFFSARGWDEHVISDSSKAECDVRIAMLEHSSEHFLLCDTTKWHKIYPYIIAKTPNMTAVIDENFEFKGGTE